MRTPTERRAEALADRVEEGASALARFVEGLSEVNQRTTLVPVLRESGADSTPRLRHPAARED